MKYIWMIWNNILKIWYWLWGKILLTGVKKHCGEIHIHGKTLLTRNVTLGHNPNFSGMEIAGRGV